MIYAIRYEELSSWVKNKAKPGDIAYHYRLADQQMFTYKYETFEENPYWLLSNKKLVDEYINRDESNSAIKPCPFCGTIPFLERKPLWRTHGGSTHGYYGCYEYDIHCSECGCRVALPGNDTVYRTDEEAKQNTLNAWNRRIHNGN